MPRRMDAVSLEHIAKTYRVPSLVPWRPARRVEALRDVSFQAEARKVTCLLGPNGAGKTSIVKILAGLIEPDGGGATVLGEALHGLAGGLRGRVGLLTSNDRSFYWRLTGWQNLDFFASLHGLKGRGRRQRVGEVLAEVGLQAEADKPFRMYSSGMKQKLLMARALLGRPELLLLDEPTNHLDPVARSGMHRFIREQLIRGRRTTVLLCTNDLSEAQKLADHLVLIDRGTVLAEGSLAALRARIQGSRILSLRFERLPRGAWYAPLGATLRRRQARSLELLLPPEVGAPAVIEAALARGGRLAECRSVEATLEEIFEGLTGAGP